MDKIPHDRSIKVFWYALTALLAAIGLYIAKSYHYLLFHTLVELFSIAIHRLCDPDSGLEYQLGHQ